MRRHRHRTENASLEWVIANFKFAANTTSQPIVENAHRSSSRTYVSTSIDEVVELMRLQRASMPPICKDHLLNHFQEWLINVSVIDAEPIPFALDLNIELSGMAHGLETERTHLPYEPVSLSSVVVLHGINQCAMNVAISNQLQLDFEANTERVRDIGASTSSRRMSMPQNGYYLLESVLLRHMSDKKQIAVVNPVFAPLMDFGFVLGTDYLASVGIDWPRDVKKMRPLAFQGHHFFSPDSDAWPVAIPLDSNVHEMSQASLRRQRPYGWFYFFSSKFVMVYSDLVIFSITSMFLLCIVSNLLMSWPYTSFDSPVE